MNDIGVNGQFLEMENTEEACRLLFNAYYADVYAFAKARMLNHPDTALDADDIASQAFAKVLDKRTQLTDPTKLLGLLFTIAKNLINSSRRAYAKRPKVVSLEGLPENQRDAPYASELAEADATHDETIRDQNETMRDQLHQLLPLIGDKNRELIDLKMDGLSMKDIAAAMNSTAGAVQKRWERLLNWLRPVALNLHALLSCLPPHEKRLMEDYLNGESLAAIAEVAGIRSTTTEKRVKQVIARWKKAAKQNNLEDCLIPTPNDDIDTCPKCSEKTCGEDHLCLGSAFGRKCVAGCGQTYHGCEQTHYRILTCENPQCLRVNQFYRQCVGHVCTT